MATRFRKRVSSERVYNSTPNSKQIHFTPRNQSILSKKPALPSSRTRQQTLTQIDFVARYVPADEDVDLNYIQEEEPRKRKRRRTLAADGITTTVETRASRRRKVKQEVDDEKSGSASAIGDQAHITQTPSSPGRGNLRPPVTPVTVGKVEIPSSQSPADTPPSTRSTGSVRIPLRSPLKALSTNVRIPLVFSPKARKSVDWHPKLEVKSSVSWENEDSQVSTIFPSQGKASRTGDDVDTAYDSHGGEGQEGGHEDTHADLQQSTSANENIENLNKNPLPIDQPPAQRSGKIEIRDSDDEDEEEDLDDAYEMGNETQGVVHGLLQSSAHLQADSGVGTHDDIQGSRSVDESDPTFPNHHQEGSVSYEDNSSFSNNNADSKHTQVNHQSNTHPHPRSISEEVSAQLTNDLYHQTQHHSPLTLSPRLLDSQSQIGFVWREYTPSLPDDGPEQEQDHDHDHDHGNNSTPIKNKTPTLSLEEEEEEEEQLRTSQISTLDPTQPSPSPRKPQSQTPTQNQQFPSSKLHPPSSLHQSSPPPFLPPLSSPSPSPSRSRSRLRAVPHNSNLDLDLGSVDVGEGRVFEREFDEYDGKVLTVSQLLPESMLNESESLDMPPLFSSQESLEEEG